MAELWGELCLHRDRLGQSPLSDALSRRGHAESALVQFRPSLFDIAAAAFHRLDGGERLAPEPVAVYAAAFFLVNATYLRLIWELIDRRPFDTIPSGVRRAMRFRSIVTLFLFGAAALVAVKYPMGAPLGGVGMCIACLIVYLRPDPPRRSIQDPATESARNAEVAPACARENIPSQDRLEPQDGNPARSRSGPDAGARAAARL